MDNSTLLWNVGCILGATGVAFGAFGAHALKRRVSDVNKLKSWETAAHYQIFHSIPILLASTTGDVRSGWLMASGCLLFSGSIYSLVLANNPFIRRFLGPITPFGGILLITGWLSLLHHIK